MRIDTSRAPVPLLIKGAAPIRLHDRNALADRARLGQLFSRTARDSQYAALDIPPPQMSMEGDGKPNLDFTVRSGLHLPLDEAASWRPIPDSGIEKLSRALTDSPLGRRLQQWAADMACARIVPFRRQGFNRARHARLVWNAVSSATHFLPVEAVVEVDLPPEYGAPRSSLMATVDVMVRARRLLAAISGSSEPPAWRLPVPALYETAEALICTLTSDTVVEVLSELAGVDTLSCPSRGASTS